MITVLTGGTGGAKFVDGLRRVVPEEELNVIVNTGDDMVWWGLHVSPDVDSILYVLASMLSKERGWGVEGDTFQCLQAMRRMGEEHWFNVGDKDLAMHLLRTRLLAEGKTLGEATTQICGRLKVRAKILPMTDARVETKILTPGGELAFEEYFVRRRHEDAVEGVRFAGAESAKPAPGVAEALREATAVLLAPSNPITSIGPILAVPGIGDALRETRATVAAVSPIIGNAAVSGPAGNLMAAMKLPVSVAGVAKVYEDFLDVLIVDERDAEFAEAVRRSGVRVHCTNAFMRSVEERTALARTTLQAAAAHNTKTAHHA